MNKSFLLASLMVVTLAVKGKCQWSLALPELLALAYFKSSASTRKMLCALVDASGVPAAFSTDTVLASPALRTIMRYLSGGVASLLPKILLKKPSLSLLAPGET